MPLINDAPHPMEDNGMSKFQHGRKVIDALIEAGIADHETRRVVIDIPVNGFVSIHLVKTGTDKVLDILPTLIEHAAVETA